jgi:hypothetical protein
MTWLISKALMDSYEKWPSSQELEEEFSEDICMDGEPSAQSSGNPIQLAYLPLDRMTKFSRLSQFGMTFRPLTADRGEDLLTWFRADFLAKTYPQPEKEQELPEADPVCGNTWHELLMKYDPDSHSWRTVRCLFPEELQWSSVTLPTWGMTVNGALFQHQTAVRPISATGFGSKPNTLEKLPTPQASDYISKATSATWKAKGGLNYSLSNPEIQRMWPTPRVLEVDESYENYISRMQKSGNPKNIGKTTPNNLTMAVNLWPTPNTLEGLPPKKLERIMEHNQKARPGRSYAAMNLRELVVYGQQPIWPTPTSHNAKEGAHPSEFLRNTPTLAAQVGGVLNADWVEWLMGWPIGWTKLEPLESFTEFDESWWDVEPVPRVLIGATARADRLKAIGNGQVSIAAATAWQILGKQ